LVLSWLVEMSISIDYPFASNRHIRAVAKTKKHFDRLILLVFLFFTRLSIWTHTSDDMSFTDLCQLLYNSPRSSKLTPDNHDSVTFVLWFAGKFVSATASPR
jgi:hypothetical protein